MSISRLMKVALDLDELVSAQIGDPRKVTVELPAEVYDHYLTKVLEHYALVGGRDAQEFHLNGIRFKSVGNDHAAIDEKLGTLQPMVKKP